MGAKPSTPQQQPATASRPRSDTFPHGPSSSGSSSVYHSNGDANVTLFSSGSRSHNQSGGRGASSGGTGNFSSAAARRARSMSAVSPSEITGALHQHRTLSASDSDESSPENEESSFSTFFRLPGSLPLRLFQIAGIKCPVCGKQIASDNVECHLVECLSKPRLIYNEDVLTEPKGECIICFDEMDAGHTIARLPCLCIYHKRCIDSWFCVNRSCPEHPGD